MKNLFLTASFFLLVHLLTNYMDIEAQQCCPSGRIRRKKPPPNQCNTKNDSNCCVDGEIYTTYTCSPSVSCPTKAYLTLNNFENDVDGSVPSECDNRYHSADTPAVALLTEWFNKKSWCLNNVTISANGRSMATMVVDECDLTMRCDSNHDRMY